LKFEDIKTPEELLKFLNETIKYGFVFNGKIFAEPISSGDMNFYKLKLGNALINCGYGLCWDVVELERAFFEKAQIEHSSFFIETKAGPTHTFILFKQNNKVKWFEYTWQKYRGIHEEQTEQEALKDICSKHIQFHFGASKKTIEIYKYSKVTRALNATEFLKHCRSGEKITMV